MALAGLAQWTERKGPGIDSSQGTSVAGLIPGPSWGMCRRQPIDVSCIEVSLWVSTSHFLKKKKKEKHPQGMINNKIVLWPSQCRPGGHGLIPDQGTCPNFGLDPHWGHAVGS